MTLVPLDRAAVCAPGFWRTSPPVPRRERPPRAALAEISGEVPWRQALDAIPNAGKQELDYDDWFRIISAIHAETGGGPEGLGIAQAWSARSGKHVPEFLEDRVWPYLNDDRAGGVTGRTIMSLATRLTGWQKPLTTDGFEPLDERGRPAEPDDRRAGSDRRHEERRHGPGRRAEDDDDLSGLGLMVTPGGAVIKRPDLDADLEEAADEVRRGIPPAEHSCTDQANANRLVREFGGSLLVAAGAWYAWDGRRWARDEGEVYRMACQLSMLVGIEAKAAEKKAGNELDPGKQDALLKVAKALRAWSAKCEMKGTIEAAVSLAKKMLAVDIETLDRNPWLITTASGTVDLRTGLSRAWRREDRITKLADVRYRPAARSLAWERTLAQVCRGDQGLVGFLRRWWGYCLTGSTREQKFAVLWGSGGNGKSVLVGAVADVMGDYATTAAPELVVSKGGNNGAHSSAVVALVGRRMATAHESGDAGVLEEAFIKAATGSDSIPARYLYGEQFEFNPTHKLQLLTNHKPTIRGQDRGMWRRVLLVPFLASFGSEQDVAEGRAQSVGDPLLPALLAREEEREAIFADLVRGAMEWYAQGLGEPEVVRLAVAEYRNEQDRVGQFVAECCELGREHCAPLSDAGMDTGLYPAFVAWCKESGVFAVSKRRFLDELKRAVPGCETRPSRLAASEGRAKVTRVFGLRLVED